MLSFLGLFLVEIIVPYISEVFIVLEITTGCTIFTVLPISSRHLILFLRLETFAV